MTGSWVSSSSSTGSDPTERLRGALPPPPGRDTGQVARRRRGRRGRSSNEGSSRVAGLTVGRRLVVDRRRAASLPGVSAGCLAAAASSGARRAAPVRRCQRRRVPARPPPARGGDRGSRARIGIGRVAGTSRSNSGGLGAAHLALGGIGAARSSTVPVFTARRSRRGGWGRGRRLIARSGPAPRAGVASSGVSSSPGTSTVDLGRPPRPRTVLRSRMAAMRSTGASRSLRALALTAVGETPPSASTS